MRTARMIRRNLLTRAALVTGGKARVFRIEDHLPPSSPYARRAGRATLPDRCRIPATNGHGRASVTGSVHEPRRLHRMDMQMSLLDRPLDPGNDLSVLDRDALRLLESRMEREIGRLHRTLQRLPRAEFQRSGDDLDVTALRQGHEADQALRARCAEGLTEWIGALHRLRERPGEFGVCERCGEPIPWVRLEVLPTARRCADC